MIHLSFDYSEDGGFHKDGHQDDFYTCWLPVTDYKYDALSIYRLQNKIIDKLSSVMIKIGMPKFLQEELKQVKEMYSTGMLREYIKEI